MPNAFDKLITIQLFDEATETWSDLYRVHARINKGKTDSEYLNAGASQNKIGLIFEIRFFAKLKEIRLNTQIYRILYDDVSYNIVDYDDYMEQHKTVKLLGESY